MKYRLGKSRRFLKQLKALPADIRVSVLKTIDEILETPRLRGAKELDDNPNCYRIWLQRNYRLVWQIFEDEGVVDILYLGPKTDDLYERLGLGRKKK